MGCAAAIACNPQSQIGSHWRLRDFQH